jgi:hypothetical protein
MRAFTGLYAPAVQCESALLANRGVIGADQLLYLEGAGWEHVKAEAFPWSVSGCLSGLFQFDDEDRGEIHTVKMTIEDQNGKRPRCQRRVGGQTIIATAHVRAAVQLHCHRGRIFRCQAVRRTGRVLGDTM